jgi:HK97 gp10 family phage protein
MDTLGAEIKGIKALEVALQTIGPRAWQNSIKRALRAGAKPISKSMKAGAPVDTGALKKSIATKISAKTFIAGKNRGARGATGRQYTAYAAIGPRSDFVQFAAGDKTGRASGKVARSLVKAKVQGLNRPVRYAHLVEFGFQAGSREVKGRGFMRRAWDANKDRSSRIMRRVLWKALAEEGRKAALRKVAS